MGKLALYGALSGLGEGMVANAEQKQKERLMKLDEERQERLAKMQMTHQEKLAGERQTFDTKQEEHRQTAAAELASKGFAARAGEQAQGDAAAMERTKVQVAGSVQEARIRANATGGGGHKPRFVHKTMPTTVTDAGGLSKTTPSSAYVDLVGLVTHFQDGGVYIVAGKDGSPNAEYQAVLDTANQLKDKKGKETRTFDPKRPAEYRRELDNALRISVAKAKTIEEKEYLYREFRTEYGYLPQVAMEWLGRTYGVAAEPSISSDKDRADYSE